MFVQALVPELVVEAFRKAFSIGLPGRMKRSCTPRGRTPGGYQPKRL